MSSVSWAIQVLFTLIKRLYYQEFCRSPWVHAYFSADPLKCHLDSVYFIHGNSFLPAAPSVVIAKCERKLLYA